MKQTTETVKIMRRFINITCKRNNIDCPVKIVKARGKDGVNIYNNDGKVLFMGFEFYNDDKISDEQIVNYIISGLKQLKVS